MLAGATEESDDVDNEDEPKVNCKPKKSSGSGMPKLPSAVDDDECNTDDDLEEVEDYEEDEKVIDIDPADYLESSVVCFINI